MLKKYLICFLVSMVPIVELRGAIPISQGMQLPLLQSYIICVIGNMLPVPVIYLFARRVLEWGADKKYIGKFFTFCIEKGHKGGEKLKQKAGNGLFIALLYSLVFQYLVQVRGQEHLQQASLIWALRRV